MITNAKIEPEVGPYLCGRHFPKATGNLAVGIPEVAEEHGFFRALLDAGGHLPLVDAMNAEGAGFDAANTSRNFGTLPGKMQMHEGAGLVRAGHHAVAAANAGVAIHQHNAVRSLERSPCRADIDAGRMGAVLTHHGQRMLATIPRVPQIDLAYPLRGLARIGEGLMDRILGATGSNAGIASLDTFGRVDQHAPSDGVRGPPISVSLGDLHEIEAGGQRDGT